MERINSSEWARVLKARAAKFEVVQYSEAGAAKVVASGLCQADAEREAARRSFWSADCWGCTVREIGSDTWALTYKMGCLNDANVDPVAVGWDSHQHAALVEVV